MKPSQVKQMTGLTVCLALIPVVGTGYFLRKPILRRWYSHQLEMVEPAEKWDVARELESLGEMGTEVAAGWYIKRLHSRSDGDRHMAAARLADIGAVAAVPVMVDLLIELERRRDSSDDPWQEALFESLIRFGPAAVPAVCGRLADDPRGSQWGLHVLVGMGLEEPGTITALGRILTEKHTHDDPDDRDGLPEMIRMAIFCLTEIASKNSVIRGTSPITRAPGADRLALETLVEGTSHHPTCQTFAALQLLRSHLVKLPLKEIAMALTPRWDAGEVEAMFARSLAALVVHLALSDDPEPELVEFLLAGCRSDFFFVRRWSADCLVQLLASRSTLDLTVVPWIARWLEDSEAHGRSHALALLRRIRSALAPSSDSYSEVVSLFAEALHDPDPAVWREASRALGEADPDVALEVIVPRFRELLESGSRTSKRSAVSEFAHVLGVTGCPPPPELLAALRDVDATVRLEAALEVGKIAPEEVVPLLSCELREPDLFSRKAVCGILRGIGPAASAAVPELVACLEDGSARVKILAAKALGRIGAGAKAAVPTLKTLLEERDRDLAMGAIRALGGIGPPAVGAVSRLRELSRTTPFQEVARAALRRILHAE